MSLDDCWRQRLLYLHLTVLWAERCSGQIKPFACRVNGVAAIATRDLIRPEYGLLHLLEWLLAPTFRWSVP